MNIDIRGYDIVATAQCDHGHVLVLNNHSTHYLVVESETGGEDLDSDGHHVVFRNVNATQVASFDYIGRPALAAYREALTEMNAVALRNCADE
jgi:hypothetical protein